MVALMWVLLVRELAGLALLGVEGADMVAGMEAADVEALLRVEMVRGKDLEVAPLLSERRKYIN